MTLFAPVTLIEIEWPSLAVTHRLTNAGGDLVWSGQTWFHRHADGGLVLEVENWQEQRNQFGSRGLAVIATDWLMGRIADGLGTTPVVTFRTGVLTIATGGLSMQSTAWTGKVSSFAVSGDGQPVVAFTIGSLAAHYNHADDAVTYAPLFQDRLVSGDTGMNLIAGRPGAFNAFGQVAPGDPGSTAPWVSADTVWTRAASEADAWRNAR